MKPIRTFVVGALLACLSASFAQTVNVYSNNPGGDAFTWSGNNPDGFQAIGNSGWYYANVRNGSTVGIDNSRNDTLMTNSNGSVHFQMPDTGTNPTGKADVEYYGWNVADPGSFLTSAGLGTLGNLTSFSYDWYKDPASTTSSATAPSLRLILRDSSGGFHYLVYEDYTNNGGSSVSGTWVHDSVTANSQLWLTHDGGNGSEHDNSLSQWMGGTGFDSAINSGTTVMGISMGVGSGWNGAFNGWADNITIGFNGQNTQYKFETVPAPTWFVLPGLLLAFAILKSRPKA